MMVFLVFIKRWQLLERLVLELGDGLVSEEFAVEACRPEFGACAFRGKVNSKSSLS